MHAELVQALSNGDWYDDGSWDRLFTDVVARVHKAIGRRFQDPDLCDDAIQSACRTFFDRIRRGLLDVNDVDDVINLLVLIAYRKGLRIHKGGTRIELGLDAANAVDPTPGGLGRQLEKEQAEEDRKLRADLTRRVDEMLEIVQSELSGDKNRIIIRRWFDKEFRGLKITYEQIADEVGLSVRSVRRVRAKIEDLWFPLVNDQTS